MKNKRRDKLLSYTPAITGVCFKLSLPQFYGRHLFQIY
jgi:hypothetical protein